METDNVGEELLRDLEGVVGYAGFDQVHHFCGAVGEGEHGVTDLTGGQRDPVHADGLPAKPRLPAFRSALLTSTTPSHATSTTLQNRAQLRRRV